MDVFYKSAEEVRAAAAKALGYGEQQDFGVQQGGRSSDWSRDLASSDTMMPQGEPSHFDIEKAMDKIALLNAEWEASRSTIE